ncbi:uncharacterized protein BDR25DRAFT_358363 [Lindgomyces ingoldianus]|uniref:Uncharacterized protein n=1 Tax=Lindgomyces ingoldianus TaxID=673940 RepID=A0ACB6QLC2_9PLEO|nr:uncharacterized protein BDR25DRAFT_358363 [Lindgomyces ingoldianus]KAF2467685.1 hypothetical protein BDR25DRAFT_358363 [Lindgomyces ingoldianus]
MITLASLTTLSVPLRTLTGWLHLRFSTEDLSMFFLFFPNLNNPYLRRVLLYSLRHSYSLSSSFIFSPVVLVPPNSVLFTHKLSYSYYSLSLPTVQLAIQFKALCLFDPVAVFTNHWQKTEYDRNHPLRNRWLPSQTSLSPMEHVPISHLDAQPPILPPQTSGPTHLEVSFSQCTYPTPSEKAKQNASPSHGRNRSQAPNGDMHPYCAAVYLAFMSGNVIIGTSVMPSLDYFDKECKTVFGVPELRTLRTGVPCATRVGKDLTWGSPRYLFGPAARALISFALSLSSPSYTWGTETRFPDPSSAARGHSYQQAVGAVAPGAKTYTSLRRYSSLNIHAHPQSPTFRSFQHSNFAIPQNTFITNLISFRDRRPNHLHFVDLSSSHASTQHHALTPSHPVAPSPLSKTKRTLMLIRITPLPHLVSL